MSESEKIKKKRGRPRKHTDITVSQAEDCAGYHREYYHKVLKKGKAESRQPIRTEETVNDEEE